MNFLVIEMSIQFDASSSTPSLVPVPVTTKWKAEGV